VKRARTDDAKDERRQLLLNAALDEFFLKGFSAARMEDIANRASLSKGTLYLYFDSKEALFEALIQSLAVPHLNQIEAMASTSPSLRESLDALVRYAPQVIRQSKLPRLVKVIVGDSQAFPGIVRQYRTRIVDRMLAIISSILASASERGEIKIGEPALMARLIVAPIVLSGLWEAVFASEDEPPVDLEALFRMHADLLVRAIGIEGK